MRLGIFRIFMLGFFLVVSSDGISQKANLQTVRMYYGQGKYRDAYKTLKSEKFKYKKDETFEYYYFTSLVCAGLYEANKELNSSYRNEGIFYAVDLSKSMDSDYQQKGNEIIVYLTSTIYADMYDVITAMSEDDSIMFDAFSDETLLAFRHFIVSDVWNADQLYFIAAHFYNDTAYLSSLPLAGDESDYEITWRYQILLMNAKKFFKILCNDYQQNCDMLDSIK